MKGEVPSYLEKPSALEIIETVALGVEVPRQDLVAGIARAPSSEPRRELLAVHSSQRRPQFASVAVQHKAYWFFIDARDTRSKQGFMILRTRIGLRLNAAAATQSTPVLTIPVAR